MSEPFWSALGAPAGAGGVDYEGAWAAGTPYLPGDVVTYQGVTYLAVNPSTGVVPSGGVGGAFVTALPGSPLDGQEIVLVDSLSAPTYQWALKYMAAKASNKWVFIGGVPKFAEVVALETAPGAYAALATAGPAIAVPVAGDYQVEIGCLVFTASGNTFNFMSYDIGGTAAVDADALQHNGPGGSYSSPVRSRIKSLTAVTLTAKYKTGGTAGSIGNRWMRLTPVAVGG